MKKLLWAVSLFFPLTLSAVEAPPRLYFSDAKISFVFPEGWKLDPRFPYGPMFWKTDPRGNASLSCAVSAPLPQLRAANDIPFDELKPLVKGSLAKANPNATLLNEDELTLDGHHYYVLTWQTPGADRSASAYFFHENRLYAVNLEATEETFDALKPPFIAWLQTIQRLSRSDAGALTLPARGGVWVHQTAGARVIVPEEWLIGVANDQLLGISQVVGEKEILWTATASPSTQATSNISETDRAELRKSIESKGYTVLNARVDAFSGFPVYVVNYQGRRAGALTKGRDLFLQTPKARWLFSFEAPRDLFSARVSDGLFPLLNEIRFF